MKLIHVAGKATTRVASWLFIAIAIFNLTACMEGGISGTGMTMSSSSARGVITNFGSVYVNGVHYDTDDALVLVDGAEASLQDLKIGMVVTLEVEVDENGETGRAFSITYNENVQGPIESIDSDNKTVQILGQTVKFDNNTVFNGVEETSLLVGQMVEISGFLDANGVHRATLFNKYADSYQAGAEVDLAGAISNLDSNNKKFRIGGLEIDYGQANLLDFSGAFTDGDYVEVKSMMNANGGTLAAAEIRPFNFKIIGIGGESAQIEGFVTRFASPQDFDVNGQAVSANNSTTYWFGSAADLALNKRIEIEGEFDASGVLNANKIIFRPNADIILAGAVEAISPASNTLTILGADVVINEITIFKDDSGIIPNTITFGLKDIFPNDSLEVKGFIDNNKVIATYVRRRPFNATSNEIIGPITSLNNISLAVLGISIQTTLLTQYGNGPFDWFTYQTQLFLGKPVRVTGQYLGNGILRADRMAIYEGEL